MMREPFSAIIEGISPKSNGNGSDKARLSYGGKAVRIARLVAAALFAVSNIKVGPNRSRT
jgi:hypothetical protein